MNHASCKWLQNDFLSMVWFHQVFIYERSTRRCKFYSGEIKRVHMAGANRISNDTYWTYSQRVGLQALTNPQVNLSVAQMNRKGAWKDMSISDCIGNAEDAWRKQYIFLELQRGLSELWKNSFVLFVWNILLRAMIESHLRRRCCWLSYKRWTITDEESLCYVYRTVPKRIIYGIGGMILTYSYETSVFISVLLHHCPLWRLLFEVIRALYRQLLEVFLALLASVEYILESLQELPLTIKIIWNKIVFILFKWTTLLQKIIVSSIVHKIVESLVLQKMNESFLVQELL